MKFTDLVKKDYVVISSSDEAYWTCFAFDDHEPTDLHCTHKYLGEQPEINVQQILDILDMHFEDNPFAPIESIFNKEEFFGEDQETRVLTKDDATFPNAMFLPDLREHLNVFRPDDYPNYKPHVTTEDPEIGLPITRYCLMQGAKIIKEY